MSNEQEWQRLQGLYAAMTDGELLGLAADKDGLTEVAQQAIDTEMSRRGLEVPVEEESLPDAATPGLPAAEDDPSLIALLRTQSAIEANQAASCLEAAEIPFELRPERYRETEDSPWRYSGLLEIVVKEDRKQDGVETLRKGMGLFPLAEVDENDDGEADASVEEEEPLGMVGNFEDKADVEIAQKALTEAGIWFNAVNEIDEGADSGVTTIEVKMEDVERALEVVEAAFDEAEQ
jgi:hypothetical protein